MFLEGDVFPRDVAVLTQEISECQRASLFVSAGLNDVNMMRVRPFPWSMKERTHGIVSMGHVNIAQRGERLRVVTERLQLFHGHLNVNDRLRLQPRNRRRAVVVDATRECPERSRKAIPFCFEFQNPARIVRRDLQSLDHDHFQPSNFTALGSLRPFLCEKGRQLLVSIDTAQHDLAERDQAVEQRDRGGLGPERGLRLGPAPEFAMEILQRVRRA